MKDDNIQVVVNVNLNGEKQQGATPTPAEVVAIAMALHDYQQEELRTSRTRIDAVTASPWSSKAFMMRQTPVINK